MSSSKPQRSVSAIEQEIRKFINRPRLQNILISDKARWFKICSSLDAIGDAEVAIRTYKSLDDISDAGHLYLIVYGILQILYVQQDAILNLHKAINKTYAPDERVENVRKLRNKSIGHPTWTKDNASHFISRSSMRIEGFNLLSTWYDERESTFENVNVFELLNKQEQSLVIAMTDLLDFLKEEEIEHREKFKHIKLRENFHKSIGYLFEKIFEASLNEQNRELGEPHVNMINDMIDSFESQLNERGLLHVAEHQIEDARYPLERLFNYFVWETGPQDGDHISPLSPRDLPIFVEAAQRAVGTLIDIADEIDHTYGSDPENE